MRISTIIVVAIVAFYLLAIQNKEGIINGVSAQIQRYPWLVSLPVSLYPAICGGSLVHPRVVITAAHCIPKGQEKLYVGLPLVIGPKTNIMLDPEIQKLNKLTFEQRAKLLRTPKIGKLLSKYGQVRYIRKIMNPTNGKADTLLLLLDAPSSRKPVRIANSVPPPGQELKLLGYGRVDTYAKKPNKPASFKRTLQSTLLKRNVTYCFPGQKMICTVGKNNGGCNGDSGGPLLNARDELVGIVWGSGSDGCAPILPNITQSVFTSIVFHKSAIEKGIRSLTKVP
jgi:hypothetical protein